MRTREASRAGTNPPLFASTTRPADSSARMTVDYRGTLPDIFKPGIQVVVEGRTGGDGVFHARTLLAKCPSRFTAKA